MEPTNPLPQEARLSSAIEAFKNGQFRSVRAAAAAYDIPKSTLADRLHGRRPLSEAQLENRKLLSSEETALVQWILSMDERGMSPTIAYVRQMAEVLLLERVGSKVEVGENW